MTGVLHADKQVAPADTTVHEPDPDCIEKLQPQYPDDAPCDSPTAPSKVDKRSRPRPDYMRHVMSPFSYIEMITYAIVTNPNAMKLKDIICSMSKAFHFLRGGYEGWKNTVRTNLSASECFKKVLRCPGKPTATDNFWIMNENCKHCTFSRRGNDWNDLKMRYQQYVKDSIETVDSSVKDQQLTSLPNTRFARDIQTANSPQCFGSPVGRVYHQVEYPRHLPMFMPIALQKAMHVADRAFSPIDLSTTSQNSRKRLLLDDEPLDLSVKKSKPALSTTVTSTTAGQHAFQRSSPVYSPHGPCLSEFRSNPQLSDQILDPHTNSTSQTEHCEIRSEVHFPSNADVSRLLTGRMYEYDLDGEFRIVETISDARKPIYILSSELVQYIQQRYTNAHSNFN